jgi:hypothetical protein
MASKYERAPEHNENSTTQDATMNPKLGMAAALAALLLCIVAGPLITRRPAAVEKTPLAANPPAPSPALATARTPVPPAPATPPVPPAEIAAAPGNPAPAPEPRTAGKAAPQSGAGTSQASAAPGKPITDPDAREALGWVGIDPVAENYWEDAINDLSLPPTERQDLIEDLNEDGLSDPKHPGPEDLPVILNRIRLIEELAPYSADQVNDDAFAEAYKDLQNLALLASGRGGGPVN